jgi:hypothetical protein
MFFLSDFNFIAFILKLQLGSLGSLHCNVLGAFFTLLSICPLQLSTSALC